jgi:protein-disulfide isomerase
VVVSEFADFQCPACKSFEPTLKEILAENEGKVRLVFKHFPLYPSPHKNAMVSAHAAEAAGNQGKFWEMHDILYEKQDEWAEDGDPKPKYEEYAREIGLNVDDFKRDLEAEAGKDAINRDKDLGGELGLRGTPSIFVNGEAFDLQSGGGAEGLKARVKQAVEEAYGAGQ